MRRRGFTLLEVIVALGILALGVVSVLVLYFNNVKAARQSKDEVTLALLMHEIRARTQLAAFMAFAGSPPRSAFAASEWLPRDDAAPDDPGEPAALDRAAAAGSSDAEAFNGQRWEAVRAKFDALAGEGGRWEDSPLYANWQFRLRTVLAAEAESNQFVDWDGYDVWDAGRRTLLPNIRQDEIQDDREDKALPVPLSAPEASRAAPPAGALNTGYFGPPRPSHGVAFDPRGLRNYVKRLKCTIGWNLTRANDIFSGQQHTFYFTVYNPDTLKRP